MISQSERGSLLLTILCALSELDAATRAVEDLNFLDCAITEQNKHKIYCLRIQPAVSSNCSFFLDRILIWNILRIQKWSYTFLLSDTSLMPQPSRPERWIGPIVAQKQETDSVNILLVQIESPQQIDLVLSRVFKIPSKKLGFTLKATHLSVKLFWLVQGFRKFSRCLFSVEFHLNLFLGFQLGVWRPLVVWVKREPKLA